MSARRRKKHGRRGWSGRAAHDDTDPEKTDLELHEKTSHMSETEYAAYLSRLNPAKLHPSEEKDFPQLVPASAAAQRKLYLNIRNSILQYWVQNPKTQLTFQVAGKRLTEAGLAITKEQVAMSHRAFGYLERNGLINFGCFTITKPKPSTGKRVIVVGAGISGVTCARELQFLGFDVTVLEAKNRVGGRINSFRKGNYVADLGAMVVTGLGGNPITVLSKQIEIKFREIRNDCPLYDAQGHLIDVATDELIEKEFNKLLEAAKYASAKLGFFETSPGEPVSLGQTIELIIMNKEQKLLKRKEQHINKLIQIQTQIKAKADEAHNLNDIMDKTKTQYLELREVPERDNVQEFQYLAAVFKHNEAADKYEVVMSQIEELQRTYKEAESVEIVDTYLNTFERHVLDWHLANLEFANSTPLSTLSLGHWDQDDDYEFAGYHYSVESGFQSVPESLAKDLKIMFSMALKHVDYSTNLVTLQAEDTSRPESSRTTESLTADAVVITVPLGVLKHDPPRITWTPELPDWKKAAIGRLGFGNLMKVVLCFDRSFWDRETHMFGFVNSNAGVAARGECYLFMSLVKAPVLIALIAGESTTIMDELPDEMVVDRAMNTLRTIYGDNVTTLRDKVVTRWREDPYTGGAYSYVAVGSTGDDYDHLAKPITGCRNGRNTVYFAGEHTMRNYPATAHGALLSGLAAAAKVADTFIGPIASSYS